MTPDEEIDAYNALMAQIAVDLATMPYDEIQGYLKGAMNAVPPRMRVTTELFAWGLWKRREASGGAPVAIPIFAPVINNTVNPVISSTGGASNVAITTAPAPDRKLSRATLYLAAATVLAAIIGAAALIWNGNHKSKSLMPETPPAASAPATGTPTKAKP